VTTQEKAMEISMWLEATPGGAETSIGLAVGAVTTSQYDNAIAGYGEDKIHV
jgi:hypothetical protein